MQWFQRDKKDEPEEAVTQPQQQGERVSNAPVPNSTDASPQKDEGEIRISNGEPGGAIAGEQPTPPVQTHDPRRDQQWTQPSPPQQKWRPEGGNEMNPGTRDRLPYPDLPVQNNERNSSERSGERNGTRAGYERAASARTLIDRDSHFNGTFRSDSDLLIEGTFEGEIDCKGTVTVAEGASVSATLQARNVVIAGSANGEVTCEERFTIVATGEVRGKAQAATLVVEEGAIFEGEFKMGTGGFSSVGSSNFNTWQTPRLPKNGSSRQEKKDADETTDLNVVKPSTSAEEE